MNKKNLEGDYRQYMDKNYIGEWDLPEDDDLIVEIDHVEVNGVKSERGIEEKPCVYLKGGLKPLIMNATNGAAISEALGTKRVEAWVDKKIILYRESVSAFGKTTMAIRVRPFPPKEDKYICQDCGCEVMDEGKYTARIIVQNARNKYGKPLCAECSRKAKAAQEAADKEGDILHEDNENQD